MMKISNFYEAPACRVQGLACPGMLCASFTGLGATNEGFTDSGNIYNLDD